jgi:hypothetical protein
LQSIDKWIAHQDVKIERSEAIRRLVELGLKVKIEVNDLIGGKPTLAS